MSKVWKVILCLGIIMLIPSALRTKAAGGQTAQQKEIEAFNAKFRDVTLSMDNAGLMALWDDDGTTLLPGMGPITSKKTISKWLDDVVSKMPGYKVTKQENDFHDIQISGDWASEWGTTHQVVQPPDGKPVIDIHGKILLVLHKGKDGGMANQERDVECGGRELGSFKVWENPSGWRIRRNFPRARRSRRLLKD
jgi:ketosteroid isomerase-like protein